MTEKRIRVALIGAGMMATRHHYPSLASFPDVDLVAISDLVEDKAHHAAARFGIPAAAVYTDAAAMIATHQPDAVYILMPPQIVFAPAHHALTHGCHVFIEKPLALTVTQAESLAYTAGEHDRLTQVGFQRRHVPAITTLRAEVEQRGPIHTANITFIKSTSDLTQPGGYYNGAIDPLTSDGIHAVDTMRWLCGGEVEEVHAFNRRRYIPGPVANDHTILASFSNGAVGTVHFSLITGRRIFRAEIHGQNITATIDPDGESFIVADDGGQVRRPSAAYAQGTVPEGTAIDHNHALGFWHENRHFIDSIKAGTQPSANFHDAVKTMRLVASILHCE
jgi:predicted dehydrogenase